MIGTGAMLRETRRGLRLELADVHAQTRIPARALEALEEDRLDLLPPDLWRAFLRDYATFLGLSGDEYLGVREQHSATGDPEPAGRPAPRRALGSGWPARAAAVAVVALAGIAVWHFAGPSGGSPAKAAQTTTRTEAKQRATKPPVAAPKSPPPALTLVAARGDCWLSVQVNSSSGRVLYERILRQGQKVRFGLRKPLWIRFGAPGNVEATIGKRSITTSLPLGTSFVVATRKGMTDGAKPGSTGPQ